MNSRLITLLALTFTAAVVADTPVPDPLPLGHDRTRPLPPVVDPGTAWAVEQPGRAPSDAVVLFAGNDLSQWVAMDGKPTKWVVNEDAMECVPGSGYVRTLQSFGPCQLHIEFATPAEVKGNSQGRGNSGVFFGNTRYEIQVLDSYENKTYADGSCGSIYNQYPPQVNASRPPGEWQSYDILWTPPQFDAEGNLISAPRITAFHNGVLIHHHTELFGGTGWLNRAPFKKHPEKLPIALQDHGNPVRYRNIWVRELGKPSKPEFMLPDAALDGYCGVYERDGNRVAEVRRGADGTLVMNFGNTDLVMFAESPTRFFAKTVDVQADFGSSGSDTTVRVSVGEDGGGSAAKVR